MGRVIEPKPMSRVQELAEEARKNLDALLTCPYGISYLDDALLGLFPREVTFIGARSGSGKTELATSILLTMNQMCRSVLYFAMDHEENEIENRILWRNIVKRIRDAGQCRDLNLRFIEWRAGRYEKVKEIKDAARDPQLRWDYVCSTSETKIIYLKNYVTAKDISFMLRESVFKDQYNMTIVDHFHALKFNGERMDAQRNAMALLSEAAQESERPMVIMGQFRKRAPTNKSPIPDLEEFNGPADLFYVPQNVIVLAPCYDNGADSGETYFHVAKSRLASDAKAFVGIHSFDIAAKTYSKKYKVSRFKPFSEPEEIKPLQIPKWAHNAVKPKLYENETMRPMEGFRYE